MNEMYWITRLDYIGGLAIGILIPSAILLIICIIDYIAISGVKDKSQTIEIPKKWFYIAIVSTVINISAIVLLPSTKDALMIYGIGGTIDYIQQNKTAQGIPDKFFKAVDKYMDKELQNDKEEKK